MDDDLLAAIEASRLEAGACLTLQRDLSFDPDELQAVLRLSAESSAPPERFVEDEDAIERLLRASSEEAKAGQERTRLEAERQKAGEERMLQLSLEARDVREEQLKTEEQRLKSEDRLLLKASLEAEAERQRVVEQRQKQDEDAVLQASLDALQADEERKQARHRKEDESDIFQAALRASKVDLGPRGISQAAKIFATGDTSLGCASRVLATGSHGGAGGRYQRDGERPQSPASLQRGGGGPAPRGTDGRCIACARPCARGTDGRCNACASPGTRSSLRVPGEGGGEMQRPASRGSLAGAGRSVAGSSTAAASPAGTSRAAPSPARPPAAARRA